MLSTVLIGLSLSMDAFAVSVSSGIVITDLRFVHAFRASLFFGLAQFFMPAAGWYLGGAFAAHISAWDHWIAFGLLAFVGGKMLIEALGPEKAGKGAGQPEKTGPARGGGAPNDIRSLPYLLTLSAATSIDALAVGLSFSILGQKIWGPAALIGAITFLVCMIGFEAGRRIGVLLRKWAVIAGGLILIGIGVKILLEHQLG
jgi:putative Mn2+ efflux pump MntP